MHFAFFGHPNSNTVDLLKQWVKELTQHHCTFTIHQKLRLSLIEDQFSLPETTIFFDDKSTLKADVLISLGGDGTILEAVQYSLADQIPILGINTGRLGFLALNDKQQNIENLTKILLEKKYKIQQRILLAAQEIDEHGEAISTSFLEQTKALNEITFQKRDSSSMIVIQILVDGLLLNQYWVDGIIIATPTGSTAYSLSCGGPILVPGTQVFCITPMAAHNLTVRPVVISAESVLDVQVEGRLHQYMLSLDNRTILMPAKQKIRVKKAQKMANFIILDQEDFFNTLRNKLHWGLDNRPIF